MSRRNSLFASLTAATVAFVFLCVYIRYLGVASRVILQDFHPLNITRDRIGVESESEAEVNKIVQHKVVTHLL